MNVQEAFCCAASVAVALTIVMPTGNTEPLEGEELIETGAVPPLAVAAGYVTAIPDAEVAFAL
jgi:hypothetical protein